MNANLLWLALAISLAVATGTGARADGTGDAKLSAFEGDWVRTEREHNDAAREAAIADLTDDLPFWARGIAHAVMRAGMTPAERYTIFITARGLAIANDAKDPAPVYVDGESRAVDDSTVTSRLVDGGVEQHWSRGDDSYGTTQWTLTDTRQLIVSVVAYDKRLRDDAGQPIPIRYATTYAPESSATSARRSE